VADVTTKTFPMPSGRPSLNLDGGTPSTGRDCWNFCCNITEKLLKDWGVLTLTSAGDPSPAVNRLS
jgi:hypothetical protein